MGRAVKETQPVDAILTGRAKLYALEAVLLERFGDNHQMFDYIEGIRAIQEGSFHNGTHGELRALEAEMWPGRFQYLAVDLKEGTVNLFPTLDDANASYPNRPDWYYYQHTERVDTRTLDLEAIRKLVSQVVVEGGTKNVLNARFEKVWQPMRWPQMPKFD